MSQHKLQAWVAGPLVACLLAVTTPMIAAETPAVNDGEKADQSQKVRSQNIDIEKLRQQIAEQQKQIEAMQKTLADRPRPRARAGCCRRRLRTLRWAKWRAQRP